MTKLDTIEYGGLIVEPLIEADWLFGQSKLGLKIRVPDGDWTKWLPEGELQKRSDQDKKACVSFGALNVIETEFNFQIDNKLISIEDMEWLKDKGYLGDNGQPDFSDRYIAIVSGTTPNGNSIKRVAEAIRKSGLIPETMLPYRKSMSWTEYYGYGERQAPSLKLITKAMWDLGQEFLERFPINYEFVPGKMKEFNQARKYNPLKVFLFAYNGVRNGVYIRTTNGFNHLAENHNNNQIFDSYNPHIKSMAPDFIFGSYGTRYIINFKEKEAPKKKDMAQVDLEKLNTISDELLVEPASVDLRASYLKNGQPAYEESFVRGEIMKSDQRQAIESLVNFFKKFGFLKGK